MQNLVMAFAGSVRAGATYAACWACLFAALQSLPAHAAEVLSLKPSTGVITFRDTTNTLVAGGANGCVLDASAIQLLSIQATGNAVAVGWNTRDRVIGVNGTASGSPCTQVRIGQGVKLSLGTAAFDTAKYKIRNAVIGLRASPKATVNIQTIQGNVLIHSRDFYVTRDQTIVLDGTNDLDGTTTAAKLWDHVIITAKTGVTTSESGAFSLTDSQFTVDWSPEGVLNCDPNSPASSAIDYAVDADTSSNKVVLRRLPDAGSLSTSCTAIPYRLDFNGQFSEFLADYSALGAGVEPQFEWKAEWNPELVPVPLDAALEAPLSEATFASQIPLTLQWFLPTDPQYVVDLCVGTPTYNDAGTPADESDDLLLEVTLVPGVEYDMSSMPGTQHGCYLKRKISVLSPVPVACPDGLCVPYRITESGFVRGDWGATRIY